MFSYNEFKTYFDEMFIKYVDLKLFEMRVIMHHSDVFERQAQNARELALKGKRVRPYLCYLSFVEHGGVLCRDFEYVLCALELFHTFALIHDDCIDGDDERRGVPTIHSVFGMPSGILAGDLLYTLAFDAMNACSNTNLMSLFIRMAHETIIGQILDVHNLGADKYCMLLKTSQYTVTYPIMIGALYCKSELRPGMIHFCTEFGYLFQIYDDYCDAHEDREVLRSIVVNTKKKVISLLRRIQLSKTHGRMWRVLIETLFVVS